MAATKMRNMRLTDEEWGNLLGRAIEYGYNDRTALIVAVSEGLVFMKLYDATRETDDGSSDQGLSW